MPDPRDATPRDTNGWSRAEMLVLDSLDRLEAGQAKLTERVGQLERAVAGFSAGLTQLETGERRMNDHSSRIRALENWRWLLTGGLVLLGILVKVLL